MKFKLLILLTSVLATTQAFSGLLVDPYFGVGKSVQKIDISGVTIPDPDDSSTSHVGARLGYSFLLFSAGVDYEMVTIDSDNATNMAAFVGVDFPILVRAWAKYYLSSDLPEEDGTSLDFKDGHALGVGFTGLPFVSINLEVQTLNHEITSGAFTGDQTTALTVLSVSLPLDF